MIWIVLWAICVYAAYRAIKGEFERPQSEQLKAMESSELVIVAVTIFSWLGQHIP